jgi:antitoxin component YwqK of YwqJK toxin-antitoxin module
MIKFKFIFLLINFFVFKAVYSQDLDTMACREGYCVIDKYDSLHYTIHRFDNAHKLVGLDIQLDTFKFKIVGNTYGLLPYEIAYKTGSSAEESLEFDEQGNLVRRCESFDKCNGWCIEYYEETGLVYSRREFKDCMLTGNWTFYNQKGQIIETSIRNGNKLIKTVFDEDSKIIEISHFDVQLSIGVIDYFDNSGFRYRHDTTNETDVLSSTYFDQNGVYKISSLENGEWTDKYIKRKKR